MNSLQRIAAATAFQTTDRVPVIAQVFGHAATLAGVSLEHYVRDGEILARCQLAAWERYGYDAVFAVMDVSVETEACGSLLGYRKHQYPVVQRHAFSPESDGDASPLPDPQRAGRMPEILKALGILRRELGSDVLVVGCVLGPFTLAAQLLGLETTLYLAIDDPPRLERLMDFATEVIIGYGRAQLQTGAHLSMVFDPAASPAVVPAAFVREFELPRLQRVFRALADAGATANWLHIAGPVQSILPNYARAEVQIANFDYCVNIAEARDLLPATCLDGNIKSLSFVQASPADIEAESRELLHAACGRGGFILSSGCEIPPESRPENVAAKVRAVRTTE